MGGSSTIENKSKVHVVPVTLKNNEMRHCRDTIQPGGRHDYDLALLDYDIIVVGADQQTLQYPLERGLSVRVAHNVPADGTGTAYRIVKLVRLNKIHASKSGGKTDSEVFYISESINTVENVSWRLVAMSPPPELRICTRTTISLYPQAT